MLAKIRSTIARHSMARNGARWGIAVSGGPDSMALLDAMTELADPLGIELGVVHINHKLRGRESDDDAAFVEERARTHGLTLELTTVAVEDCKGENLEAAARAARYRFFEQLLSDGQFDRIATGHTQSDQAETVLFRVLRGTGLGGLAAVRPTREPGIVRPLIDVTREEVMQWLGDRDTAWREDSSNQDTRFSRNRIRHELLPQLAKDWNPRVTPALARLAEQAALEEAYWQRIIEEATGHVVRRRSDRDIEISCEAARRLDPAVLRRCLDKLAHDAKAPGRQLDTTAIERLESMTSVDGPDQSHLPGLDAQRSCDLLLLRPPGEALPQQPPTPMVPGDDILAPDGRSRVALRIADGVGSSSEPAEPSLLDGRKLPASLHLRAWQAGDKTPNDSGERLLRDMFRRAGIPAWERDQWPVLVAGTTVVWSRGFGASGAYASTSGTEYALQVTESLRDGRPIRTIADWTTQHGPSRSE